MSRFWGPLFFRGWGGPWEVVPFRRVCGRIHRGVGLPHDYIRKPRCGAGSSVRTGSSVFISLFAAGTNTNCEAGPGPCVVQPLGMRWFTGHRGPEGHPGPTGASGARAAGGPEG